MADKPSRGLVVYGDGLARFVNESHTHLHSLASRGFCGFLSLPDAPPSESDEARIVREFGELVDAPGAYQSENGEDNAGDKCMVPTISERFMGVRSAIVTNDSRLQSFAGKLGFTVLQPCDLIDKSDSKTESPPDVMASELLKLLGFQEGKTSETSSFDLIIIHIGDGVKNGHEVSEYVNNLLGGILDVAKLGSEIGSRLHLSLVLSFGAVSEDQDSGLSVLNPKDENNSNLSSLFPRQSYTVRGQNLRTNVRQYCPMLVAQWQDAVTRKDMTEAFSFKDFKEHGGMLTIPADRFIHEVAFKLWKAPKYGA